jgi:hypothetical protein
MNMKKINYRLTIGYPQAIIEDSLEVADDATVEEIEKMCWEAVCNHVEWNYEIEET